MTSYWEATNIDARSGPITLDMMEAAAFRDFAGYWEPLPLDPMLLLQPTWIGPERLLTPMEHRLSPWLALWRFEP